MMIDNKVSQGAARELLAFHIGAQEFCVDIMAVREIRGWTNATALPHAPPFVRGIVNLRGLVLPIIDLAARLGFPSTEATDRCVIIVTELGPQVTGLLVDAVSGILTVTEDMIQPTPDVASELTKMLVKGIVTIDGRMLSVLSLDRALPEVQLEAA